MPRYYFHVRDGLRLVTDDTGKELAGIAEARGQAEVLAGEIRCEMAMTPSLMNDLRVEITDSTGKVLDSVNLNGKPRFH
jgi:hypothetical protein